MTRTRVLIAGGGVAALETALALRDLAEERVELTVLAPEDELVYRPLAVAEPFGLGDVLHFKLSSIAADAGADLVRGTLVAVDAGSRIARTQQGDEHEFDTLVVACGARRHAPFERALTFSSAGGTQKFRNLLHQLELGRVGSVAFALPGGCGWPLPLYELALLTASHLAEREVSGLELVLVTPERSPLELFGADASEGVRDLLVEAGIGLLAGSYPAGFSGRYLRLSPAGRVVAERVVTLARVAGPGIEGLPTGIHGFIPVDEFGRVPGLRSIYAAGDATTVPIKQGGLAAQLADVVAAAIAVEAGASVEARPFAPVLRGLLLTGGRPRFMRAELAELPPRVATVAEHALWWPPSKIVGRYLAPYLARVATTELAPAPPEGSRPIEVEIDLGGADQEEAGSAPH
jgi:sulfide:quinone oxidoreductase